MPATLGDPVLSAVVHRTHRVARDTLQDVSRAFITTKLHINRLFYQHEKSVTKDKQEVKVI